MNPTTRRRLAALVAVAAASTTAPLAFADTVEVSLSSLGGTRQFAVEDSVGNPLTAIDLRSGGTKPFRTRVTDSSFTNVTQPYTVSATMSNLYFKSGSSYDYAKKVPSSAVSLVYPTSPLSALGVSFPVLPRLSLTGTIPSCASLDDATKSVLGLDVNGLTTDVAVTALCTAIGTGVTATTAGTAPVDGLAQTVQAAVTSLLDIPTQLTGAQPGAFTEPDYGSSTVGFNDPAKPASNTPTSLQVMRGTSNMTDALKAEIESKLTAALGSVPLTTANDVGAETTLASVLTSLGTSTDTGMASVGSALAALDAAKQSAVANLLASGLLPVDLSRLTSLSGQYYGFPSLKAAPTELEPGTYAGTLTVTFVQQ